MCKNNEILSFHKELADNSFDILNILSKEGIILYDSKASKRILGYEIDERMGSSAFKFIHLDDVDEVKKEFLELIKESETAKKS